MALLGTLIGGTPDPAAAASRAERHCGPVCQERRSRALADQNASFAQPARQAAPTATSALALLHPVRTLIVTTAADVVDPGDGRLSLREAVAQANATAAADRIVFAGTLEGRTLTLRQGELVLRQDVMIDGDRNNDGLHVTIDGDHASRIFNITGTGTDVGLTALTLTHGYKNSGEEGGNEGGAVFLVGGDLTVTGSTIIGNAAAHSGGGIFADGGTVTVTNSQINGNRAQYVVGGAIAAYDANLTIRHSEVSGNYSYYTGPGIFLSTGSLTIADSRINDNSMGGYVGHAIASDGTVTVTRTTISGNDGGVKAEQLTLSDSTIANNHAFFSSGGGIAARDLVVRNSTITGNYANGIDGDTAHGGGIFADHVDIANSIVAGNSLGDSASGSPDIFGTIVRSNGHNVFGSDVDGNVAGDRENISPGTIFAALDPDTGGGRLSSRGIVPLKNSLANPAVSGADPLAASATGQLGTTPRPRPVGSLPDIGSIEIDQPLSTGATPNNDVIAGSAAANVLRGLAGNDLIRALGGNDAVGGDAGSDLLDGGPGNNRLDGGPGVDLVTFAFSAVPMVVDLTAGIARRGGETDQLASIEGAIGTAKADRFTGDEHNNWFQGGLGRDLATGGGGRDTYDFDRVQDSPVGATSRDVIGDFVPGQDVLDLTRIDADPTVPGNQAFRWVGTAPLTGVGQLGYVLSGGNTIVRASTDNDPAAELEIQLTGRRTLTETDVRL